MKRSELKVGAELAYIRYKNADPVKVVVAAVEPHEVNSWARRGESRFRPCPKGNGVLIKRVREFNDSEYEDVVQLRQLIGPWAEVKAEHDAEEVRKQAARQARADEIGAADSRASVVISRLAEAGIVATSMRKQHVDVEPLVVLKLDEAERLATLFMQLDAESKKLEANVRELIQRVEPLMTPKAGS
jgi:hypothetical protein